MERIETKKGPKPRFLLEKIRFYLQLDGAHLVTLAVHFQPVTAPLAIVAAKVTIMSFAAKIEPVTVIKPVVSPTVPAVARWVAVNGQLVDNAVAEPFADTDSVTQVRKPLAAKIISDALARLV